MTSEETTNAATEQELERLAERIAGAMLHPSRPGGSDPPFLRAALEADRWARERYGASIELLRQHQELGEELAALLASLEWGGDEPVLTGDDYNAIACCPRCRGLSPPQRGPWADDLHLQWGHRHDCALKAALEGREAADGEDPVDEDQRLARYAVTQLKRAARLEPRAMPPDDYPPHHASFGCMPPRSAAAPDNTEIPYLHPDDGEPHVIAKHRAGADAGTYESTFYLVGPRRSVYGEALADLRRWEKAEKRSGAHARAAALANRCMVAEGQRDRLRDRIAETEDALHEIEAEAQEWHRLYKENLGPRAAEYNHHARDAQLYRLRYARALRVVELAREVVEAWDADPPYTIFDGATYSEWVDDTVGPKVDAARLALAALDADPEVLP